MPRKKVVKRQVKQKQKQNVKVSQNVKVIVGDVKRKQVRKSKGAKAGAGAKPPIILNISNPQPYNNPYMEYFKNQLQNQQPIQANTLNEQVKQKEKQETEASKAGALGKLVQEPDDVARENRRQRVAGIERFKQAEAQQRSEAQEVRSNLKPVSDRKVAATPLRPRQPTQLEILMGSIRSSVPLAADTAMLSQLRQRQNTLESAISNADDEDDEEEPAFPQGGAGENPSTTVLRQPSRRGRKPSDIYTPQEGDTTTILLDKLSEMTEAELDKKLTGVKLKAYMLQLGLPNREKGSTNPLPAQSQRIAILGLIQSYKRDSGMVK